MFTAGFQRDKTIEELKRLDALLEHAVKNGMVEEAERIRKLLQAAAERIA